MQLSSDKHSSPQKNRRAHSLRRFSFCALVFLSCVSDRFQKSPYLRVSCQHWPTGQLAAVASGRRLLGTHHAKSSKVLADLGEFGVQDYPV